MKLIALIGGMQKHQSIKTDGICTCLTSAMGMGGGYVPLIILEREKDDRLQNVQSGFSNIRKK